MTVRPLAALLGGPIAGRIVSAARNVERGPERVYARFEKDRRTRGRAATTPHPIYDRA